MHALQDLGVTLVELSTAQLAAVELPDDLRDAVLEARRITGREGRRRQMQYIGRLMRDIDPAPIRAKIDEWHGQSREATAQMHAVERWRERLLADDAALTEFANEHPGIDLQALRALIRETPPRARRGAAAEAFPRPVPPAARRDAGQTRRMTPP